MGQRGEGWLGFHFVHSCLGGSVHVVRNCALYRLLVVTAVAGAATTTFLFVFTIIRFFVYNAFWLLSVLLMLMLLLFLF